MPYALDNLQQKHIYVVLGMPRSGTSAITRGLKALGVELGEALTPAHQQFNAKGFWEDKEIVYDINHHVLQALNMQQVCGLMDESALNNPSLSQLKTSAITLLQQRTTDTQFWGFKDPSTSRIVPFWRDVFDALSANDQYIIALRNPLSSAHSVTKHTRIDLETALLMWLMHIIPAIDATANKHRVIISFELMMQHPRLQLDRIRSSLVFPIVPDEQEIDIYVNEFLDDKLRHFTFNDEEMKSNAAIATIPLCLEVYTLLMRVAQDKLIFNSAEFESAWSGIKQAFAKAYPAYQYMESLRLQNKALTKEIHRIKRSLPWKLLYPLRKLDQYLRTMRRTKRKLAQSHG